MVNETHGFRVGLRRVAIRIGEGLVIGIGAAMALSGYNALVNATDQLEAARKRLEAQETINERLSAIAGESKRTDEEVRSDLTDLNKSLKAVVSRIEEIESGLTRSGSSDIPDSAEWSELKERTQGQIYGVPKEQSKVVPTIERYESLENLDKLIKEQKQIK